MAETDKVTNGIQATNEMVEQLGNAFNKLESHRESYSQNKTMWEDIKKYFHNLGTSLEEKLIEVEGKERAFEKKQSEARKLIKEREAAVAVKEHASLNHLQELKDTAASAIVEARNKCKVPSPVIVNAKGNKDNKVSTSLADDPNKPFPAPRKNIIDNQSGNPSEAVAGEVKPYPQLKELCEQIDSKGLLKYLSENQKNLTTIREELSNALKSATEPARLVLDSLEGFYPPYPSNSQGSEDTVQLLHRTCLVVMESAAPLLGMAEPCDNHLLSSEIKQQAKAIADEWKAKLAGVDVDASNGYSLEVVAFLQLLATFSIVDEFDEDELCKLVLAVARHRQAPNLCRALGLTHKMPGFIETLVNRGRQIDAVHFAHAFQLTESFPPVPLLKDYLNTVKTTTQENAESSATANGQKEVNNKELGAIRIVIKCIEEYKLQEQYPVMALKKRVAQLEKAKHVKKRTAQAANSQAKKPRANGGYTQWRPSIPVDSRQLPPPVYDERGFYPAVGERYPERYNYAAPPAYDTVAHALYDQQQTAQGPYHYPDEIAAPPAPCTSSSNYGSYAGSGSSVQNRYENYMGTGGQPAPSNYGGYIDTGMQPPHQPPYM
ncbi:FRIGIDA-like protein 3 [Iris pallida]|uniref:FRIGIDA-like protein n=1 Tax=Iris pallida TaxID=29817 RepID=A0AAX6EMG5_IRIPA|nr:FRIGIDA-like protein 3 [Iris pallida]